MLVRGLHGTRDYEGCSIKTIGLFLERVKSAGMILMVNRRTVEFGGLLGRRKSVKDNDAIVRSSRA
jgi:hypothetical protein